MEHVLKGFFIIVNKWLRTLFPIEKMIVAVYAIFPQNVYL